MLAPTTTTFGAIAAQAASAKTNPQKGEMRGVDKYTECHTFIRPVVHII